MSHLDSGLPSRFADIKQEIAASYPDFEERVTRAWVDVLEELEQASKAIASKGSEVSLWPLTFPLQSST